MIVPEFWAEARVHQPRTSHQRQITVRRFGWSDLSQAAAAHLAQQRAEAALAEIVSGRHLPRREPKMPYNGADGVPIREEVLSRHGDVVITRNSYGAQCLNTPDVLFADIDFAEPIPGRVVAAYGLTLLLATVATGLWLKLGTITFFLALVAVVAGYPLAALVAKTKRSLQGGAELAARQRIEALTRAHPGWILRLYRTPAGFRVLVLHALFDPTGVDVADFFSALKVDRIYATMCRRQRCFRARVSPKPWRIGIGAHLRPRPGVWPVHPRHLPVRQSWIKDYESRATGFAACRLVDTIGAGTVHPKAEAVRELHDRLSQAESGREIA